MINLLAIWNAVNGYKTIAGVMVTAIAGVLAGVPDLPSWVPILFAVLGVPLTGVGVAHKVVKAATTKP